MRIAGSLLGVLLALAACDSAPEPKASKAKSTKADRGKAGGPTARFDPKGDGKDDGDGPDDGEDDGDGEPEGDEDGDGAEGGDEPVDPVEEFANSREDKIVEVTATPGTPEWFVQGLAAFRAGNIDPIVANFARNITWDAVGSPLAPPSKGSEAVRSRWEDLLTGIPDMKLHARRIFHQGELIVMQVVLTGSHKGDFRGLAPTNKKVGAEVLAWVWHDKEGKAKKVLVYYNEAAILAQMGVLGEGTPVPPIPEIPEGEPEIITGDTDAAAKKAVKELYAAGKESWKVCQEKLCVEGIVGHDMAGGTTMKTPEEHQAATEGFFGAFPDLKPKIDQSFAFGPDWVVVSMRGKATHKGDLGELKATNKKVNLVYAELVRFEEGKIAETWGYWNNLDLLAQLGVFTPPEPKPSSTPYEGPPKVADPDDEGDDAGADDADEETKEDPKKVKKGKGKADEASDEE